jgi:hypothetical protein
MIGWEGKKPRLSGRGGDIGYDFCTQGRFYSYDQDAVFRQFASQPVSQSYGNASIHLQTVHHSAASPSLDHDFQHPFALELDPNSLAGISEALSSTEMMHPATNHACSGHDSPSDYVGLFSHDSRGSSHEGPEKVAVGIETSLLEEILWGISTAHDQPDIGTGTPLLEGILPDVSDAHGQSAEMGQSHAGDNLARVLGLGFEEAESFGFPETASPCEDPFSSLWE